MHFNPKKLVAMVAVGAAVVMSSYPAHLKAITATIDIGPETGFSRGNLIVEEPEAIDIWLAKLAFQESGGRHDIKVLDVNHKYSYGCLQFQEATFRRYAIKYGFISEKTPTESAIYDCGLQKELAKLMLAENYSNWRAWYTSSKKTSVGLPPAEIALAK